MGRSWRYSLKRQVMVVSVICGFIAGMSAHALAQVQPQGPSHESAQEKQENASQSTGSTAEDAALTATSVLVSVGQVPLRAGTCGATFVVAGIAYLLTIFDKEARQGPADAIKRVCEGPYITTPEDLRGTSAPSP